jgi:hypothetical protein
MITDCGPILIVDEDEGFRDFASRLFDRAGFPIEEAATGGRNYTLGGPATGTAC